MKSKAMILQRNRMGENLSPAKSLSGTKHRPVRKTFFSRIAHILFFVVLSCLSPRAFTQKITLSRTNVPLQVIFSDIEKQQDKYRFFYNESLLEKTSTVTIEVKDMPLENALEQCFSNQPVTYVFMDNTIVVRKRDLSKRNDPSPQPANRVITVRGRVTDHGGQPIAGATISVKGTTKGVSTDESGMFVLEEVDENATLVVSSVSHAEQEVKIKKQSYVSISLEDKVNQLDETIVVAYNTIARRSNVGALTVVKGEQIRTLPNRSLDKSLQGLVPGLQITQGTGLPGGGLANFVLRGIATGGNPADASTVRNPLIVIDGVPVTQDPAQATTSVVAYNNPMSQLNPLDVESITVLKDAAAIALYGAKASNGVILVTTKKGKAGRTVFNFSHQVDLSRRLTGNADMLSQQEYLGLLHETFRNTDPVYWTTARIDSVLKRKFPTRPDGSFYPAADWLNELYRPNAVTTANNISMSGGNEKSLFYLNLEYTKQDGIEKSTDFDRKSIRFNYETRPATWLKIGLNSALSYTVQNYSKGAAENTAAQISPLNPVYGVDGDYIYHYSWGMGTSTDLAGNAYYFQNPAAAQKLNINRNTTYRGLSKVTGEARFLRHFTFSSSFGVDFMLTEAKEKIHPKLSLNVVSPPGVGQINQRDIRNGNLISTNILRYDRLFNGIHRVNIIAGQEAQILSSKNVGVIRQNLSANPVSEQLNIGNISSALGLSSKQTLLSYFQQANYAYNEKYLFSASIRTDGSSLFGANNRYGTHWSAGAGWLASAEPFLKNNAPWLDLLKFRASIGSAGNSAAISNALKYDQIVLTNFLNGMAAYPYLSGTGNPGIQWEKTFTWDAGLELRIFRNRIQVTADIYSRKTSEVIGNIEIPRTTGYATLKDNIGDLKNNGVELSLSADVINAGRFRWNINANWSMNRNKLVKSYYKLETSGGFTTVTPNSITVNGEGRNYNSFYLVQWAGVDPATGQPLWIDSLGKVTSNFSAAKPGFAGKPQPDGFGAVTNTFSWGPLDFSAVLYYQYGFQVYNSPLSGYLPNDGVDPFINQTRAALNRWQKPGDIAANPRRLLFGTINGTSDGGTNNSTRYLFDGDFIRLSNVSISYRFPKKLMDQLHLGNCRIYVQGHNLKVWTKFSGRLDPENVGATGSANTLYPLQRSYSVGINLDL